MAARAKHGAAKGAAVIGSNTAAVQAALALARMGVPVKLITDTPAFTWSRSPEQSPLERRYVWPLLLRAATHPLVTLYSNADVGEVSGSKGDYKISVTQRPRYTDPELCTACGRCETECSVCLVNQANGGELRQGAIHSPEPGARAVPSAYVIDKYGAPSPCNVACPLGINVQGYVSLISKGKPDKALKLINEAAPLAGILGRVCTHPCETPCNRAKFDNAVSIRSLHRHAADSTPGGIRYGRKAPARCRDNKIAIVGSGPAGLTAAWELTRRGYSPTVFESHSVIGGMLATGIPRFRLPREVREREIQAIRNLGVDIRTGVTLGRDITYHYLRERGYQAFFLAIGTQQNAMLGIPGEEVNDVVDCLSFLFALNLQLDTFVGQNVAVIGGGNAAIDTARSSLRAGAKAVTIFYRRTRQEMPANDEEVEEALEEGIKIEYNAVPVEILTEAGRVTAIHCLRSRMTGEVDEDGREKMETMPDSGFLTDADHVVVAIGQSPDSPALRMPGLETDKATGIIKVNPLTLATSLNGVFAGGDCITGPNTVVAAMAAGLRAAESIDRYVQGRDLETGRSLELPETAEVDPDMEMAPYSRARMPVLSPKKRLHTYEETTLGLTPDNAVREAQRCLNCGLCSQCLECEAVCELGAVRHQETTAQFEVGAEAVLRFPEDAAAELTGEITEAMAQALEAAAGIAKAEMAVETAEPETLPAIPPEPGDRLGVFLCTCGGATSDIIDFTAISRRLARLPGVDYVKIVEQSCTADGARLIAGAAEQQELGSVVVANCRCCNLEQICYTCTDRRQMSQRNLQEQLPDGTVLEFCNIREQCAWAHQDDPREATRKAAQIITAGIARAQSTVLAPALATAILPSVLVLGGSPANRAAAAALAARGYSVAMVSRDDEAGNAFPWPESWQLLGYAGNYEAVLKYADKAEHVNAGAVLVDIDALGEGEDASGNADLLKRIMARIERPASPDGAGRDLLREITVGKTTGIFLLPPDHAAATPELQSRIGLASAARVAAYLEQGHVAPKPNAIIIDTQRCRGCGDCAAVCPYIEIEVVGDNGAGCARINNTLCLGCGACLAVCATGAITQPRQTDEQIIATLSSMLGEA